MLRSTSRANLGARPGGQGSGWGKFVGWALVMILVALIGALLEANYQFLAQSMSIRIEPGVTATVTSIGTSLVTLTATNTEIRTETVTSTTTAPPSPTYEVWGRVTLADFTTPLSIIFSSDAEPDRVFQINNRMHAGTLTNSVAYAVNVTWYNDADPLRTPNSSGCGTFNQTVGAGSSAIRMDWAC